MRNTTRKARKFLFTTLPSNDLGLLTRSLPIAAELAQRGHRIAFCSPAEAPTQLIAAAGFDNLLPRHPLYHLMTVRPTPQGLYKLIKSEPFKRDFGNVFNFLGKLIRLAPTSFPSPTSEIWNMDHIGAFIMPTENLVRTTCEALMTLMADFEADVIVDFWNPLACMAARAIGKPLVAVIQADMHPDSRASSGGKSRHRTSPPLSR